MKSVIIAPRASSPTYPKLMQSIKGEVYLMTSLNYGALLKSKSPRSRLVGNKFWVSSLDASKLKDFTGTLELSND